MSAKTYLTAILSFFFLNGMHGQITTKLDLRLWKQMEEGRLDGQRIALLVKGDISKIQEAVERAGGIYKYGYNNISSVEIPGKNLSEFSLNEAIEKIENTAAKGTSLMDTARIRNNVDSVHAGFAPLPHDLKGRNVVVGIIDGGIYWQHEDFKKPNGDTRIRYIWDQRYFGQQKPLPYLYGNEWNWIDIDNGNCAHVAPFLGDSADYGHGTCVAGIASGNGLSTKGTSQENKYTGVAPESEIIAVRISYSGNFLANVADAVDYIFKKADALGKPCVINTSIGTYYGSHDGIDLSTQLIETLIEEKKGRVVVAAAGNGGKIPHHLGYTIPADSAFTFFKCNASRNEVYFDLWADTANFKNALFAIGCNDPLGNNLRRTSYLNVPGTFNPSPGNTVIKSYSLPDGTHFDKVDIAATLDEGRYHVEVLIRPYDVSNYWRLQTSGSGRFDLWSSADLIQSADMTSTLTSGVRIQYPNYRHPDSLKTMVSSWQNSDKVITVGNYSNRAGYFDYDSNYVDLTTGSYDEVVGRKFSESSFGPTRDNRMKPDIMATGSTTLSTGDANDINLKIAYNVKDKIAFGGKHLRNGGTSMASPIVAGIAALYLEKLPAATYDEIKRALICTAKKDSFTGSTPNFAYGHGKVNAFRALTAPASCFVFGAKDTFCINYNPLANADTGGCVAKVYGCTDSTAGNYNPLANVEDGSCDFTSILHLSAHQISVSVIPNPFTDYTTFKITGLTFQTGSIRIYNQLGALVHELPLSSGKTDHVFRNPSFSKGIYTYMLNADEKMVKAGKLVIE